MHSLTCDISPEHISKSRELKTRSMSVIEPNRHGQSRRHGRTRAQRRREARRRRRDREEATRRREASFHCDLFASDLLRLLRASNFRAPNGSRYYIVVHAHGARVTWSTNERRPRTPDRGTRSLVYTTPSTPFRARHPYTTLDQSSLDDEPNIRWNENLQMRLERRGAGATAETWHDMTFAGNQRSSALEGGASPPWPFETSLATSVEIDLDDAVWGVGSARKPRAPSQEPSKRFGVWDPHENPGHRPNDRNAWKMFEFCRHPMDRCMFQTRRRPTRSRTATSQRRATSECLRDW